MLQRAIRERERNALVLDVCVPQVRTRSLLSHFALRFENVKPTPTLQWLVVAADGSATCPAGTVTTLSADGVKRDDEADVETMQFEVLARSDDGTGATRVRIACDRRARLATLVALLRSALLPPPSSCTNDRCVFRLFPIKPNTNDLRRSAVADVVFGAVALSWHHRNIGLGGMFMLACRSIRCVYGWHVCAGVGDDNERDRDVTDDVGRGWHQRGECAHAAVGRQSRATRSGLRRSACQGLALTLAFAPSRLVVASSLSLAIAVAVGRGAVDAA
jgi:hypothetical protein